MQVISERFNCFQYKRDDRKTSKNSSELHQRIAIYINTYVLHCMFNSHIVLLLNVLFVSLFFFSLSASINSIKSIEWREDEKRRKNSFQILKGEMYNDDVKLKRGQKERKNEKSIFDIVCMSECVQCVCFVCFSSHLFMRNSFVWCIILYFNISYLLSPQDI